MDGRVLLLIGAVVIAGCAAAPADPTPDPTTPVPSPVTPTATSTSGVMLLDEDFAADPLRTGWTEGFWNPVWGEEGTHEWVPGEVRFLVNGDGRAVGHALGHHIEPAPAGLRVRASIVADRLDHFGIAVEANAAWTTVELDIDRFCLCAADDTGWRETKFGPRPEPGEYVIELTILPEETHAAILDGSGALIAETTAKGLRLDPSRVDDVYVGAWGQPGAPGRADYTVRSIEVEAFDDEA